VKTISLAAPTAWFRQHLFQVQLLSLTLLVLAAAGWIVVTAGRQKTAVRADEARLHRTAATLGNWAARFQPAASEESTAWRQTLSKTRQLGSPRDDRLTLAREIAGHAERAGFTEVRVAFEPPDSATTAPLPPALGPYAFVLAPYRISVKFRGDLAATRVFIGNLPPAVVVTGMQFKREATGFRGTVTLDIHEPAGGQ
jgi:hypothetical protein